MQPVYAQRLYIAVHEKAVFPVSLLCCGVEQRRHWHAFAAKHFRRAVAPEYVVVFQRLSVGAAPVGNYYFHLLLPSERTVHAVEQPHKGNM